jgi:hypothetical protein
LLGHLIALGTGTVRLSLDGKQVDARLINGNVKAKMRELHKVLKKSL